MTEQKSTAESFKADAAGFADKLKALIHQGNVRRVVVEHEGHAVAEFPLTASGKTLKRELVAWARESRIQPTPCRFGGAGQSA